MANTMALTLSDEYTSLLHIAGNPLADTHPQELPPVPLSDFSYVVMGRLNVLRNVTDGPALVDNIKQLLVKTALKKVQPNEERTEAELDAIRRDAEAPAWMDEFQAAAQRDATSCRYVPFDDKLHPNSISRFHILIRRAGAAAPHPAAAPVAGVGGAQPPQPAYYVMDLGSLNSLYINGIKVRHQLWTPLYEGSRIRFAPTTVNCRQYTAGIQAARAENERRRQASMAAGGSGEPGTFATVQPVLPHMPLSVKDMHIEYTVGRGASPPNPPAGAAAGAAAPSPALPIAGQKRGHASVGEASPPNPLEAAASKRARTESEAPAAAAAAGCGAAAPAAGCGAAAPAAAPAAALEEFSCGICHDIIYKFAVLDCGHSFCNACISEWFKKNKKKVCPICRVLHKGAVRPVRAADNVIEMMVQHSCTAAEKEERAARVMKIDAEAKEEDEKKEQRRRKRAELLARAAALKDDDDEEE